MGLPIVFAAGVVGKFKGRFKTPSEKRARKVIPSLVSAANAGNMRAVAVIDLRRGSGISKERAEWVKAYGQINATVLAAYLPNRSKHIAEIPPSGNITGGTIEGGAEYALNTPVAYEPSAAEQALEPVIAAARAQDIGAREAFAQTAEAVGVGGGAALAQGLRGTTGPLDTLIEFAKKPGGTLTLVAGGVVLLVVVGSLLRR